MTDVHPDDEALSAHLDGEAPRLRPHIDGCASCSLRLDQFRRARAAVATPVAAPEAQQRDAAIANALAAGPGAPAAPRHSGIATRATGIAAAILLVIGAAFAITQLSDSGGDDATTAARSPAADRNTDASEGTPAPEAVGDLGDLGELSGSAALRAIVEPQAAAFALDRAGSSNQEFTTSPAAPSVATDAQDRLQKRAIALDCAASTRALDPANVGPTYVGTATWQGAPASVLVYAVQGQERAVHVYVVARSDCRVLEYQSYTP